MSTSTSQSHRARWNCNRQMAVSPDLSTRSVSLSLRDRVGYMAEQAPQHYRPAAPRESHVLVGMWAPASGRGSTIGRAMSAQATTDSKRIESVESEVRSIRGGVGA